MPPKRKVNDDDKSTPHKIQRLNDEVPRWVIMYQNEIRKLLYGPFPKELIEIVLDYFVEWDSDFAPFQQYAFNQCMQGKNLFITGPAGTGKTFLLESIIQSLRAREQRVVVTASTGRAAIMIHGQTIHSFAKLNQIEKYGYPDLSNENHSLYRYWHSIWSEVDVLMIDEVSMLTPHDFATLVRMWTDLGVLSTMQVILIGDFFQLPPVIKKEDVKDSFNYCFETPEWNRLLWNAKSQSYGYIHLYDVFRQTDELFIKSLNAIRIGNFTSLDIERLQQRWIEHPNYTNDKPVYSHKDDYTWIFPTNEEADRHNYDMLNQINEESHTYNAIFSYAQLQDVKNDRFINYSRENVPNEKKFYFSHDYRNRFHVKEQMILKQGVRVLLTINLHARQGLVNGSRGTVIGFRTSKLATFSETILPLVRFDNGVILHVFPHTWELVVERTHAKRKTKYMQNGPIISGKLVMVQLPLRYAYATTVHQSQGQSLSNVVISLRRVFADGQGYVALSRARTLQDLHLLDPLHAKMFHANPVVQKFYDQFM